MASKTITFDTNLVPKTTNDANLGTSSLKWNNVYASSFVGNASTATTLQTGRNIQTNLGSTAAASFNGSTNITPGVTGTLPIANGGTDGTTAAIARANLGVISATNANGYYGMGCPDGNTSDWIRTTSAGIIPYQSGSSTAGHSGLGTSSWYFATSYVQNAYNTYNHIGDCTLVYDSTNKCLNFNFA